MKYVVKTNAFIGKFIDQTLHVVEHVRTCAPWIFINTHPGEACLPVKNRWPKTSHSKNINALNMKELGWKL